jgi:hypothetical protein
MNKCVIFMLIVCVWACSHEKENTPAPVVKPLPCAISDTVSFQKNIVPIFNQHCNTSGCHSGSKPEKNFNLEPSKAYATLTKKGSGYVDTIDPTGSVLYSAMVAVENPMPPKGRLDSCTLKMIQFWMKQGGKNN